MTFASSVLVTRLLVDHLYKSPVTVTGVSAGPSGAPEAAVRSSRRRRRQRFCRGNLLQDLPAVCGVQPPPAPDTPEPAAGPAHWYTSVLCIIHLCTWLSEPIVFCLCMFQRCVRPRRSPALSTVTRCVWRSRRRRCLVWSFTLRMTWRVYALEERWSKLTEDTSANWSVTPW